jgi:hypothetical protein
MFALLRLHLDVDQAVKSFRLAYIAICVAKVLFFHARPPSVVDLRQIMDFVMAQ